jgi:RNA polymerase sigma factor (TIGR02999 family)
MAAEVGCAPVTELLARSRAGDVQARDEAYAAMYEQLKLAAHRQLRGQRQALQTTALVHEAWLKLAGNAALAPADRNHLMALSTRAMRQVLVDHARHVQADKRDGAIEPLTLAVSSIAQPQAEVEVLALHGLLEELQGFDPRAAQIVELRYFGGYEEAEIAAMLDTSLSTVQRDWRRTRAWLAARLGN